MQHGVALSLLPVAERMREGTPCYKTLVHNKAHAHKGYWIQPRNSDTAYVAFVGCILQKFVQ